MCSSDLVAALASALRGGALPACTEIYLTSNQIGDDGVAALASLPSCMRISLDGNPGSRAPVDESLDLSWNVAA